VKNNVRALEGISHQLRQDIIEMLYESQSGHPGGSLSAVEILVALYYRIMNIDPQNPGKPDRDRFILSKGHAAPVYYAILANMGFFKKSELMTLRKINSILQGHPDMKRTPGVDFSTGSLGQGLSVACGMALGARLNNLCSRFFVLLGDGELDEGQVWEAAMLAAKYNLDNVFAIIDENGVQLDGDVEDIMPLEPLDKKWAAFGWNVFEVNGHDIEMILNIFETVLKNNGRPSVIIARTIKGKGVSFMENKSKWHGAQLSTDDYVKARGELADDRKELG
jgi:transketolase